MAISSPGVGSNLDVNSIVTQLMAVEQKPITKLNKDEASYQAKLSAYGNLSSALSSFQSAVRSLSSVSKFQGVTASPADATVLSASASSIATAGTYAINVSSLAQSQKLVALGQADTTSTIGTGTTTTLTFDLGTISGGTFDSLTGKYTGSSFTSSGSGTKTVTIDSSNNSLVGIKDAINNAKIGVSASIVNDGGTTPYRLVISSDSTGKANSVKLSVSGDASLTSLLAHDPSGTQNLAETVTAKNADFTVNGVAVSKSSNTVSDVIQGVTLNLLKTTTSSTNLVVARDTASVSASVNAFVKAYNELNKTFGDLTSYDSKTQKAGLLQGDSTARTIQTRIRSMFTTAISSSSGGYTTLSQIGVALQKDGTMSLDASKLQSAMDSNFNDIARLFAAVGKPTDSLVSYAGASSATKAGSYALAISQLATQGNAVGSSAVGTLTIAAGSNDTLSLSVDGVAATVTLAARTYTLSELTAEIQSKINGASAIASSGSAVSVTESGGVITIKSNRYGSASNVSGIAGNGAANLLGALPTSTVGKDVAGTIGGVAGVGSGQTLTGATGSNMEGLKLTVSGGATGTRGTVDYTLGYAYQLDKLIDTFVSTTGTIANRTDGINQTIKTIGSRRDALNTRLVSIEQRYRDQFTRLDTLISSMTKTSTFLTQQLANLPKIS